MTSRLKKSSYRPEEKNPAMYENVFVLFVS